MTLIERAVKLHQNLVQRFVATYSPRNFFFFEGGGGGGIRNKPVVSEPSGLEIVIFVMKYVSNI